MSEQLITTRTTRESVLNTPETWIGSIMPQTIPTFLRDYNNEGNAIYTIKSVTTVPAIHNCIQEALDNASDYATKEIQVHVNRETKAITIRNDVVEPISMRDAQTAFCDFRSSSNYEHGSGTNRGRNGVGIKGLNTWCTEFRFTIGNHVAQKQYSQTCRNNLSTIGLPRISKYPRKTSFVEICFVLDFTRFRDLAQQATKKSLATDLNKVDRYVFDLITRQVLDVAASCSHLKVKYKCGRRGPGGEELVSLPTGLMAYLLPFQQPIYECKQKQNATICIMPATDGVAMPSFVNHGLMKGGTHVKLVQSFFLNLLTVPSDLKAIKSIKKKVKDELWFVVSCMVENPVFDGQTKMELTTPLDWSNMFSKTNVKSCLNKLGTWDVIREKFLPKKKVATQTLRSVFVPKYDAASDVKKGGCSLILTEGDSAKSLATAGLSVVGRKKYGVFPLGGKIPNAQTYKGVHKEVESIMKIMGLKANTSYPGAQRLRYRHIIIMCDADPSGYHIGALLINFIGYHWPELLAVPGFFQLFQTPIVRVTKGTTLHEFLTIADFDAWKSQQASVHGYRIKHLKGLGSSKISDAKRWFRQLSTYLKPLEVDAHACNNLLIAFGKDTQMRKQIILGVDIPPEWGHANPFTFSGYMQRFLKEEYWMDEQQKKCPHVMDGLTEGQRKALYFMPTASNRTAQQAARIAEISRYANGESSMIGTINNFNAVYKNNICPFLPDGQFGSMDTYGGFAAARYTYTSKSNLFSSMYVECKYPRTLSFREVEGHVNEPIHLAPILPMVLVNGFDGIAVGFSCKIPRYNPKDLYHIIMRYINKTKTIDHPLVPWYRGWKGPIVPGERPGTFVSYGIVEATSSSTAYIVTAIPVETSIQSWIHKWNKDAGIKTVTNASVFVRYSDDGPSIDMLTPKIYLEFHQPPCPTTLCNRLKLQKVLHTSNMHLWGVDGTFRLFNTPMDIAKEYCVHREALYETRRQHLMHQAQTDRALLTRKCHWVQQVVQGHISLPFADSLSVPGIEAPYDDLLAIPMRQLKASSIQAMNQQILDLDSQLVELEHTTACAMWKVELEAWHDVYYGVKKRERS